MTKLLIDECLSPALALMARERGRHEASHVVWIGSAGWKDWELKPIVLEQDWVLSKKTTPRCSYRMTICDELFIDIHCINECASARMLLIR